MDYTVRSNKLSLTVTDDGGTMKSLIYLPDGAERLWQGGEYWTSRDVAIFPVIGHAGEYTVCGREFAPKSHGVVRYSKLSLKEKADDSVTLCLKWNEETFKTFPFRFEYEISYKVEGNAVKITYFIRSLEGNMPFYVGGHPGMVAPGGSAEIEFENEESPVYYPLDSDCGIKIGKLKRFIADKRLFAECKTLQLGSLSGGSVYAHTQDGYTYEYLSDCPLFAFWSNEKGGDYVCVEPWWGINDFPSAPKELSLKPFINFDDGRGKSFFYTLKVTKN